MGGELAIPKISMSYGLSIHIVGSLLKALNGKFVRADQEKEDVRVEIGIPFDYSNRAKPKKYQIKSPKFILKSIRIANPENGIIGI